MKIIKTEENSPQPFAKYSLPISSFIKPNSILFLLGANSLKKFQSLSPKYLLCYYRRYVYGEARPRKKKHFQVIMKTSGKSSGRMYISTTFIFRKTRTEKKRKNLFLWIFTKN